MTDLSFFKYFFLHFYFNFTVNIGVKNYFINLTPNIYSFTH